MNSRPIKGIDALFSVTHLKIIKHQGTSIFLSFDLTVAIENQHYWIKTNTKVTAFRHVQIKIATDIKILIKMINGQNKLFIMICT